MNTTERAAAIRTALKAKGWNSRAVSVRADYYSMGSSINVLIKSADVPLAEVKAVAEAHESIRRCEITGEILSGGNRYVSVSYTSEAQDIIADRKIEAVEQAAVKLATAGDNALIEVPGTDYLLGRGHNGYGFSVWQDSYKTTVNTLRGAALYIATEAIGRVNQ